MHELGNLSIICNFKASDLKPDIRVFRENLPSLRIVQCVKIVQLQNMFPTSNVYVVMLHKIMMEICIINNENFVACGA
jgi:hypothetical protein